MADRYHACANHECQHHRVLLPSDNMARFDVEETRMYPGGLAACRRSLNRHLYRSTRSGFEFRLCDVCHAACEMLAGRRQP